MGLMTQSTQPTKAEQALANSTDEASAAAATGASSAAARGSAVKAVRRRRIVVIRIAFLKLGLHLVAKQPRCHPSSLIALTTENPRADLAFQHGEESPNWDGRWFLLTFSNPSSWPCGHCLMSHWPPGWPYRYRREAPAVGNPHWRPAPGGADE